MPSAPDSVHVVNWATLRMNYRIRPQQRWRMMVGEWLIMLGLRIICAEDIP